MWHGPVPRLAVFTRTPEHRAIVITPDRYWTTTAHEVGHALGLAHTHADRVPILERYEWPDGHLDCLGCRLEGDGICDTPPDPGRAVCTYSYPECQPICDGDWAPDVTNVMSYYTDCRQGFTPEQAGRMRQGLVRLFVERQAQRRAER